MNRHDVLRLWCVFLTDAIDKNYGDEFDFYATSIKQLLDILTKEEQEEILQDTDLKGFLESFEEFKEYIK